MNFRVLVEEEKRQGFKDKNHLEEFLQNLFRTDKRRKGTNKNTEHCVVSFYFDGNITSIPFGDIDRRMDLKSVSSELIEAYGMDAGDVESSLINLSFVDEEDRDVKGQLEYDEVIKIVSRVITQRKDFNRCLFHVTHLDQGDYHIHSIIVKY